MNKLLFAASAAALLTVAGIAPAMAQSSSSGMTAPAITCKDLSTMDRETARSVVFYFSGFQAASGSMQAASAGSGSTTGTTGSSGSASTDTGSASTTADAGTSGAAGSSDTSGASGSASTTADAGSSGTAGSTGSSDVTGSTSSAAGSDTNTAAGSASSTGTSGASSGVMAQLPGFSNIDIEKIMSDCQSSPDRQLSEMINQGSMGSGSSTTP